MCEGWVVIGVLIFFNRMTNFVKIMAAMLGKELAAWLHSYMAG